MIRPARLQDRDALAAIENGSFDVDRFSRRSFHTLLTRASAETFACGEQGRALACMMRLFDTGTSRARLYSLAVDPALRARGIGSKLIEAPGASAVSHDCIYLRLEVRRNNATAIHRYEKPGYKRIGLLPDAGEHPMEALRYGKRLAPYREPGLVRVPYYEPDRTALSRAPSVLNSHGITPKTWKKERIFRVLPWPYGRHRDHTRYV